MDENKIDVDALSDEEVLGEFQAAFGIQSLNVNQLKLARHLLKRAQRPEVQARAEILTKWIQDTKNWAEALKSGGK